MEKPRKWDWILVAAAARSIVLRISVAESGENFEGSCEEEDGGDTE